MKLLAIGIALIVLSGCSQKKETSGFDACKNNGGVSSGFSAQGGGTRVLWLCQDGSVRWSDAK